MHGQRVIIRSFGGRPILRTVESWTDTAVYVAGDLGVVGFPLDDVFECAEGVGPDQLPAGALDWGTLRPWRAERS